VAVFLIIVGFMLFLGGMGLLLHTLVWGARYGYAAVKGQTRPRWGDLSSERYRWIP
jgi:hypothetical protein